MNLNTGSVRRKLLSAARQTSAVAAGTALATMIAVSAQAQELRFVVGLAENYTGFPPMVKFAETLTAETDLEAEVFSGALLTLAETADGVRDGIVDAGFVVFPYAPAQFSELNLIADLSMLVTTGEQIENTGAAMAGATMEYILLNCPDCLEQLEAQNQVFLAAAATTPYALQCNGVQITTPEDIEGKKMRAGAANYGRWAEHFGGVQVRTQGEETYDALNQGAVDCSMTALAELLASRYIDVTTSATKRVPGGSFSGIGANNFNAQSWAALTDEQRQKIIDLSAQLAADMVIGYYNDDIRALEAVKDKPGFEVLEPSQELLDATAEFVEQDIETIKKQATEQYGIENVEEKVETIRALIDKWKGLTADITTDAEALAEIYHTHIFSKLDASSYGLN